MKEQLTVRIKHVYGNRMVYPVSENARQFARLINAKTFTDEKLAVIKALGYEIVVEQETL